MSTDPPSAHYWETLFGITTFEQFQAATNGALDLGLPHVSWIDTPIQKTAYYSPLSAVGAYLTAALTAEGFHEDSPSGPATVVVNSLDTLLQHQYAEETAMTALVIPDCFQVSIQMVAGAHLVENVIGVQNSAGSSAGAAAAVKTAWEVASGPMQNMSNLIAVTNYHAVDIRSSTGTITDLASTAVGGLSTATLSTRAACALIKWNGSNRSRSTRGRLYFGPIREADIDPDGATVSASIRTSMSTAFTNFRNSLSTSGYPLVVLSRKTSTATPVTQHAVETLLATQRRRIR